MENCEKNIAQKLSPLLQSYSNFHACMYVAQHVARYQVPLTIPSSLTLSTRVYPLLQQDGVAEPRLFAGYPSFPLTIARIQVC